MCEPIWARGREKKGSPMVLWYSQAIDALILLPSVLQQYLKMKSSSPLNNNTWGYLFSERIMIPWCHAGCDLKRLGWHNCYHLRDAQTFLRLVWCRGNSNHLRHRDNKNRKTHTHTHAARRGLESIVSMKCGKRQNKRSPPGHRLLPAACGESVWVEVTWVSCTEPDRVNHEAVLCVRCWVIRN